jgi:hypothetical protein
MRIVAVATLACAMSAFAQPSSPFRDAIDALKANDCVRLGTVIDQHLDASPAVSYLAGALNEEGVCVDRDLAKAARYYAAADARKDDAAALDMALAYLPGDSLPRSYGRAGAWFWRSRALRHDASAPLKAPRGLPTLPAVAVDADGDWAGYLVSVAFVASRTQRYPSDALRIGAEGHYRARVCVAGGTVSATAVASTPGPAAGVASLQGQRQIRQAIEDNYQTVMRALPRPSAEPRAEMCFDQPLSFRLRR